MKVEIQSIKGLRTVLSVVIDKKTIELKKLMPHLSAVVLFVLISLIYLSPVLEGKKIDQQDIRQFTGMSKEIVDHRSEYDEEPLLTNRELEQPKNLENFSSKSIVNLSLVSFGYFFNHFDKLSICLFGIVFDASFIFITTFL